MDILYLKSFFMVAREGNLTRAAEHLHLSQPAVSAHIKALEQKYNVHLFDRKPKGMTLTSQGQVLLDRVDDVLQAHRALHKAAQELRSEVSGAITMGVLPHPDETRIDALIRDMQSYYPALDLQLCMGTSGENELGVYKGELDAAFVVGNLSHDSFNSLTLRHFTLRLVAPASWSERVNGAPWAELMALPWILAAADSFPGQAATYLFEQQESTPQNTVTVSQGGSVKNLVIGGVGLAFMLEEAAQAAEVAGKVVICTDLQYSAPLQFIVLRKRMGESPIIAVMDRIRNCWQSGD